MWAVVVTSLIVALCQELVSLCRSIFRRASIERIVRDSSGVIRIVDRTAQGDVLEIEVLPCNEKASGPDLRSEGA